MFAALKRWNKAAFAQLSRWHSRLPQDEESRRFRRVLGVSCGLHFAVLLLQPGLVVERDKIYHLEEIAIEADLLAVAEPKTPKKKAVEKKPEPAKPKPMLPQLPKKLDLDRAEIVKNQADEKLHGLEEEDKPQPKDEGFTRRARGPGEKTHQKNRA